MSFCVWRSNRVSLHKEFFVPVFTLFEAVTYFHRASLSDAVIAPFQVQSWNGGGMFLFRLLADGTGSWEDLLMMLVVVSCKRSANRGNNKASAAILWGWWSLPHSHAVTPAPPPHPPCDVSFWVKSSWKWKLCGWIPVGVSEKTSGALACWQDSNLIVWPSVLPLQTPLQPEPSLGVEAVQSDPGIPLAFVPPACFHCQHATWKN